MLTKCMDIGRGVKQPSLLVNYLSSARSKISSRGFEPSSSSAWYANDQAWASFGSASDLMNIIENSLNKDFYVKILSAHIGW